MNSSEGAAKLADQAVDAATELVLPMFALVLMIISASLLYPAL